MTQSEAEAQLAAALLPDFGPSYFPGMHDVTIHGDTVEEVAAKLLASLAEHGLTVAPEGDAETGKALREATEALPEGASLKIRTQPWNGYTTVSASPVERPAPPFEVKASGDSIAAAARSLTAALRKGKDGE